MIKQILMTTLITTTFSLASGLYTTKQIDTGIANTLTMDTLTKNKILSSTSVYFNDGVMTEASKEKLQVLLTQAPSIHYVSVIGHTSEAYDIDHSVKLSLWAELWQNLGANTVTSTEAVNSHIQAVYDYLKENNIPATNIYNQNRMDAYPVSTEATAEGKALNNRVDITFYK